MASLQVFICSKCHKERKEENSNLEFFRKCTDCIKAEKDLIKHLSKELTYDNKV